MGPVKSSRPGSSRRIFIRRFQGTFYLYTGFFLGDLSPDVRESKTFLNSGFHVTDSGFRIPGTGIRILCQWNLDSGFQSLVGFQIPRAVFRIPKPRTPDSTANFSMIPNSTRKNFEDSEESRFPYIGRPFLKIIATSW